jgi:hypothetical protein
MSRVFLSYGREDLAAARRLYAELTAAGVHVWVDFENLLPGQEWQAAATAAIRRSQFFVVLLSNSATQRRGFLHREIREALHVRAEMPAGRPFLIQARLDDCVVAHPELRELHWVNLFEDWDAGVAKILRVVKPSGFDSDFIRFSYLISVELGTDLEKALSNVRALKDIESAALVFGEADILVVFAGPATAFAEADEKVQSVTHAVKVNGFIHLPDNFD